MPSKPLETVSPQTPTPSSPTAPKCPHCGKSRFRVTCVRSDIYDLGEGCVETGEEEFNELAYIECVNCEFKISFGSPSGTVILAAFATMETI